MPKNDSVTILLVEDDEGHARLIERSLRKIRPASPIIRASDGQTALDYLRGGKSTQGEAPKPQLVLLDINLPRIDGFGVLDQIKKDGTLRSIPVIMLTSTDCQEDVDRCYRAGANGYIAKPSRVSSIGEKLHHLGLFLEIVELPAVA